jgi:hypothetical protein
VDQGALPQFDCVKIQQRKRRAGRMVGPQRMERFRQPALAAVGPDRDGNDGLRPAFHERQVSGRRGR